MSPLAFVSACDRLGSSQVCGDKTWVRGIKKKMKWIYLGESTVVPDVPVVGEAIPDVAQSTLLDVLLDRIEYFLFGNFHLGVGPAGNLDYHVEDTLVSISEEGDIVEW